MLLLLQVVERLFLGRVLFEAQDRGLILQAAIELSDEYLVPAVEPDSVVSDEKTR